jgi:hypothetical protein
MWGIESLRAAALCEMAAGVEECNLLAITLSLLEQRHTGAQFGQVQRMTHMCCWAAQLARS